ncbi:MAG: conjugal transfer protein TraR [Candidatus Yonathbacteria bacterium]|nr:conjugal transfer protein TraR [Candidatus Yonathbacteria bacterium]
MNTDTYKQSLIEEKTTLERELGGISRINPEKPEDWQPMPDDELDVNDPDLNVRADAVEEFVTRVGVTAPLEARLAEVTDALERIEAGTYGTCKVCGKEIEEDRLEANPAATTCKEHINVK